MNLGEYWLTDDGAAIGADGDINDYNHEGYVMERVQNSIVSNHPDEMKYSRGGYVDWEQFKADVQEEYYEEALAEVKTPEQKEQLQEIWDNEPEEFFLQWLREEGVSDEDYAIAEGMGDAREYAMKNWRWKRMQGTNIESWTLTPDDWRIIADGVYEVVGEGDDTENRDELVFSVSSYQDGKSYEVPYAQLSTGPQEISSKESEIEQARKAANQQTQQQDRNIQHPYYRNKPFGDSVLYRGRTFVEYVTLRDRSTKNILLHRASF